ncbi:hypothetical protein ACTL32_14640 [Planococcus sp. FY231025]|uniref:hypothetical protein n=1 Tax=Planococcus sp. FY231025 TaxID=3455699 RepID=UPI003F8FF585
MKKPGILLLMAMAGLLAACGTEEQAGAPPEDRKTDPIAESAEGDFIYRLAAESDSFKAGGPVSMYAELEYTGERESIDIYHAASPFYFHLHEKTRDFEVPYPMNEPLIMTTLIKGEPLRERYRGSGGYAQEDPEEYREFIQRVMDGRFPVGFYEVDGSANFYTENPEADKTDYDIHAAISFEVVQ